MAGIAATLPLDARAPSVLDVLCAALAARGPDCATRQVGRAELLVRAGLPAVHGLGSAALVIDGIAEASALAARYVEHGPVGLLHGPDPYAVICASPGKDGLVLARNGDGPPLYYAVTPHRVVAASEPEALIAAGAPAQPDPAVVHRFLDTGACDDTEATFFSGVRRLLPGQVVEVSGRPFDLRTHRVVPAAARVSAQIALHGAVRSGRIGVRLGNGLAGAAICAAALTRADRPRPLNAYSTTFPGLTSAAAEHAAALLGPLPLGAVRHRAQPFFADEMELDALLADLGEPVPDLASYLIWAAARGTGGEIDTLVDPAAAREPVTAHLPRLADRVASRYGVALRFPFREVTSRGEVLRAELGTIIDQALPAPAAAFATGPGADPADRPPLREVLRQMRADLVTAALDPLRGDRRAAVGEVAALLAGRKVDAGAMLRRYVLERWLRVVVQPLAARSEAVDPAPPGHHRTPGMIPRPSTAPPPPPATPVLPRQVEVDGRGWDRHPVTTEMLTAGDKTAEKLAWYIAEAVAGLPSTARRPWYVLIAARPVTVTQGRARLVWEITPGWLARGLCRLAGPHLDTPWAAQVAIEVGGRRRVALAVLGSRLGRAGWFSRLAGGEVAAVRGPRSDAVPPGPVAVLPPPGAPDRVAADVVAALRTALPPEAHAELAGCALVSVGDTDCRVLGFAAHGGGSPAPLHALCAGNPFGQRDERTPVVIAVRAAANRRGRSTPPVLPGRGRIGQ